MTMCLTDQGGVDLLSDLPVVAIVEQPQRRCAERIRERASADSLNAVTRCSLLGDGPAVISP